MAVECRLHHPQRNQCFTAPAQVGIFIGGAAFYLMESWTYGAGDALPVHGAAPHQATGNVLRPQKLNGSIRVLGPSSRSVGSRSRMALIAILASRRESAAPGQA